jgi:hypothetical protein
LLTHGGVVTNASIGLIVPLRDGHGPADSAYAGRLGVARVGRWHARGPRVVSNVTEGHADGDQNHWVTPRNAQVCSPESGRRRTAFDPEQKLVLRQSSRSSLG